MSEVSISRKTHDALARVMLFFGIDACNRPLFGVAARVVGVVEFSRVIDALDAAISADQRCGVSLRIRDRIERQRALDAVRKERAK